MIIEEGQTWKVNSQKLGSSKGLVITRDMLDYLGIKDVNEDTVLIVALKADKGRHGKFIAFWVVDANGKKKKK